MFKFEPRPYTTVEQWAADRGQQILEALTLSPPWLRPEGKTKPSEMTDLMWNNAKVIELHPQMRDRFSAFLYAVDGVSARRGADLIAWYGLRLLSTQLAKYQQGRTKPGRIVTKTISSLHLVAMAIDLCVRTPSGQPSFDLPPWFDKEILPLAAAHGLRSLFLAKGLDRPHIEVPPIDRPPRVREILAAVRADFRRAAA